MAKEPSFSLRSLLDKEKLKSDGMNFMDWHRNLRIVLRYEKKEHILTQSVPKKPHDKASQADKHKYTKFVDDELDVSCLMVTTMSPELQKRFETHGAYEVMDTLKNIFQEKTQTEMYNVTKSLMRCTMRENESVSAHMLKMTSYIEQLEKLGCKWDEQLMRNIVLGSLSSRFSQFIMNYNMMGLKGVLDELLGLLKTVEEDMNKMSCNVLAVSPEGKKIKKSSKRKKGKGKGKAQVVISSKSKSKDVSEAECFYCKGIGHWKRSCPKYLKDKKNGNVPTSSGILVIEINLATSISNWVLDTGSCSHICSNVQALKNKRLLGKGEMLL
jgi:gag-polypeptide of LTR copia-type/Zinc knuckle